jgi:hypothetical protein
VTRKYSLVWYLEGRKSWKIPEYDNRYKLRGYLGRANGSLASNSEGDQCGGGRMLPPVLRLALMLALFVVTGVFEG